MSLHFYLISCFQAIQRVLGRMTIPKTQVEAAAPAELHSYLAKRVKKEVKAERNGFGRFSPSSVGPKGRSWPCHEAPSRPSTRQWERAGTSTAAPGKFWLTLLWKTEEEKNGKFGKYCGKYGEQHSSCHQQCLTTSIPQGH